MQKCYIASGWFNENQARDLENIKNMLFKLNIPFYSPKDELLCPPNASPEQQEYIFSENIKHIKNAKFMVVNTRDKDVGTIFEAGVGYAFNIPIIYYCEGLKGNFNLMLSRSGNCVATNIEELAAHLVNIKNDINYKDKYLGIIE